MVKDLPLLLILSSDITCLFVCYDVVLNNVLSMDYKLRILNRKRLYSLINDLPTLFEVVTGRISVKDNKPGADGGSKSWNSTKVHCSTLFRLMKATRFGFIIRCLFAEINWWTSKEQTWVTRGESWGGWWCWEWWNLLWKLWGKLQFCPVLDRLWHLWTVVPRQVCEDYTGKSRKH